MSIRSVNIASLYSICILSTSHAGSVDHMLFRARDGVALGEQDRAAAKSIYEEWRDSETVEPGSGDPILGRALQTMSAGRRLNHAEANSIQKLAAEYAAAQAAARDNSTQATGGGSGAGNAGRGGMFGSWHTSSIAVAGGASLLVLVMGVALVVLRPRLSKRGPHE